MKHVCSECGYAASQKVNLKKHIEAVHKKIRHPCGQCGQAFSQKGDLKRHIAKEHAKGEPNEAYTTNCKKTRCCYG